MTAKKIQTKGHFSTVIEDFREFVRNHDRTTRWHKSLITALGHALIGPFSLSHSTQILLAGSPTEHTNKSI